MINLATEHKREIVCAVVPAGPVSTTRCASGLPKQAQNQKQPTFSEAHAPLRPGSPMPVPNFATNTIMQQVGIRTELAR